MDYSILLPSKPRVVLEEENKGVFEIDNLYPGYGHTLGNSLRRIILSSMLGAAITSLKIDGVSHEFTAIDGIKEDVLTIILNLKKVRFKMTSDEPQKAILKINGKNEITAGKIEHPAQLEVLNKDLHIAKLTDSKASLNVEMIVERGLGFVPKEALQKEKVEAGNIAVDAVFTPVQRVSYEVENMRYGEKTNYNRLRINIETDGTISPREALQKSIEIMIRQLQAIVEFKPLPEEEKEDEVKEEKVEEKKEKKETAEYKELMKTRIDSLDFSSRVVNALNEVSIRTLGGLSKKSEEELVTMKGLGKKGIEEIRKVLKEYDFELK